MLADVRDGLGPYLSVFLKGGQDWQPAAIGIAMATSSVSAALAQIPAGAIVDGSRAKRLLVAGSGLAVALGCVAIALRPTFATVIAAQVLIGFASTLIAPTLAALSLGLVGRARLDARISRNESFNHGGNFAAALLAGTLGQRFGYQWIFYLLCGFAIASALFVRMIDPRQIDHELARGGETVDPSDGKVEPVSLRSLLKDRVLIVFLLSVTLFHFGNAAMLPMAGQVLAKTHPGSDTIALSFCIIAAQLVMVGVAWAVGRAMSRGLGRKTIFLVAFAVLPIRGLLFSVTANPVGVVLIQLLDGVSAGIFGVVAVVIAADIMEGTGRFNLAQGLVALAIGIGAGLSNLVAGFVVEGFGYSVGFLFLATIAFLALLFFAVFMPETGSAAGRAIAGRGLPLQPRQAADV